jgi:hypothetical protein
VCCFGILHRVENSLGLLRVLHRRTVDGGTVLVETYGVGPEDRNGVDEVDGGEPGIKPRGEARLRNPLQVPTLAPDLGL